MSTTCRNRAMMRAARLRSEGALQVSSGLIDFQNYRRQDNDTAKTPRTTFETPHWCHFKGAQLQPRPQAARASQRGKRLRRSSATGSVVQEYLRIGNHRRNTENKMRGKSAKGFILYRLGLVSITKTQLTNLSCSSDSEASHQDTEIVKVWFFQTNKKYEKGRHVQTKAIMNQKGRPYIDFMMVI